MLRLEGSDECFGFSLFCISPRILVSDSHSILHPSSISVWLCVSLPICMWERKMEWEYLFLCNFKIWRIFLYMKVIMICQILQDYPIHSKGIIRYRRTNQDRKIQMLPYSLLSAFIHVCCFFSVVLFKLQLYSSDPFVFCMYIKLVSMVELIIQARI